MSNAKSAAANARQKALHHKKQFLYHEAERENGDEAHFNHHDHAGGLHGEAHKHFSAAARRFGANDMQGGNASINRAYDWAEKARKHTEPEPKVVGEDAKPGTVAKHGPNHVSVIHHHEDGIHSTVVDAGRHRKVKRADLKPINEEDINEALVAKVAGVAAKLAAGHQFGDVAQQGAEYAVNRGEQILRSKLSSIKKGAQKLMGRKHVNEMVGSIERESNKENARSDGGQNGPDPKVQRELKNHGILHRTAMRKAAADRKLKEEAIDELTGKGKLVGIWKHHRAEADSAHKDMNDAHDRDNEDDHAEAEDRFYDHNDKRQKAQGLMAVALKKRRAAKGRTGLKTATGLRSEETIDELSGKGSIDAIGKHHSARMVKSNPSSAYHVIMRNRAMRLKNVRDGDGPLGKTKMKDRMPHATADSKAAKKLKPVNEAIDGPWFHVKHDGKKHDHGTDKKSAMAHAAKLGKGATVHQIDIDDYNQHSWDHTGKHL